MSVETAAPPRETRAKVVSQPTRRPKLSLPPLKKLLFMIHGWLGLSLGLPLFVICLSGSFAVVSHEIDWLARPFLTGRSTGKRLPRACVSGIRRIASSG